MGVQATVQRGHAVRKDISELTPGEQHVGYIRSVTSHGCFVGLVHGLVSVAYREALISVNQQLDH